jgi:hypothetical protein
MSSQEVRAVRAVTPPQHNQHAVMRVLALLPMQSLPAVMRFFMLLVVIMLNFLMSILNVDYRLIFRPRVKVRPRAMLPASMP